MYFIQPQNKVHFIYKVHFLESEHYTLNSDESRVYLLSRKKYKNFQFFLLKMTAIKQSLF